MQRFNARLIVLVMATAMSTTVSAGAETVPAPNQNAVSIATACGHSLELPDRISADKMAGFTSDPQGILKANPLGGQDLSGAVKSLTITDPVSSLDAILDVARSSSASQATAIGTGLGQAVKAIMGVNKTCADQIAQKIAGTGMQDLLNGYRLGQIDLQGLRIDTEEVGEEGVGGAVNGVSNTSSAAASTLTKAGSSLYTTNTPDGSGLSGSSSTCRSSVSPWRNC
jgi:hypothetical protein